MNKELVLKIFKEHLNHLDEREISALARIYVEDVVEFDENKILDDIEKLKANVPIQYITGVEVFLDYKFKVGPSVLIPRPETEELVVWIYEDHQGNDAFFNCLDVGTGSGIIPISLKLKFPQWNIQAIDVSEEALAIAKINAINLSAEVTFAKADFLNKASWEYGKVDVLVSNPPYIAFAEAEKMGNSVVKHEPHLALFVNEALDFYKALCEFSRLHLMEDGVVYAELNEFYAEEIKSLFQAYFKEVDLKKDMQGKDRMLRARHLLS